MRSLAKVAIFCLGVIAATRQAEAIPLLQLDMAGGVYDPVTETIVAPGGPFTLYAVLTPGPSATTTQIAALLGQTYYVSVALTPPVGPASASLGSFDFAGTTVNVTADMTYGTPPIETVLSSDPGDLPSHGVFPTYFSEFSFTFNPANTTLAYNSQDSPGGLTPDPSGTAYYAAFAGDSSLLATAYNLHFDLYDVLVASRCRSGCPDIDVSHFAPFSHDAETVPEPATGLLVLLGIVAAATGAGFSRHRRGGTA